MMYEQSRAFAQRYFQEHLQDRSHLLFHDWQHTLNVVAAARLILDHSPEHAQVREAVLTAAWFHDLGYGAGPSGHEARGAALARSFLEMIPKDEAFIEQVESCILATRIPHQPQSFAEMVLCDADLAHLAAEDYFTSAEQLRRELEYHRQQPITPEDWLREGVRFFQSHQYFTPFGKTHLAAGKQKNLLRIQAKLQAG